MLESLSRLNKDKATLVFGKDGIEGIGRPFDNTGALIIKLQGEEMPAFEVDVDPSRIHGILRKMGDVKVEYKDNQLHMTDDRVRAKAKTLVRREDIVPIENIRKAFGAILSQCDINIATTKKEFLDALQLIGRHDTTDRREIVFQFDEGICNIKSRDELASIEVSFPCTIGKKGHVLIDVSKSDEAAQVLSKWRGIDLSITTGDDMPLVIQGEGLQYAVMNRIERRD